MICSSIWNVIAMFYWSFFFNSAEYDPNLLKSCLLPILVPERIIEPTIIKNASHFISFKIGDFQLLYKMNFLGGSTALDSFLNAKKHQRQKDSSPKKCLVSPRICKIHIFPRMMPSTVNFPATILSKSNTLVMLTYCKVDWPQKKPS